MFFGITSLTAMVEPAYGRAWAIEHSLKRWQHQYPIVNPSIHPSMAIFSHRLTTFVAFVSLLHFSVTHISGKDWIGLDLLSGTGVATALRIVQWPTLFLTRP